MDENNFLFSLYSNDLIYIESRGDDGVNFCDIDKSSFTLTSFFAYYKFADIANGNIAGVLDYKDAKFKGLGLQRLRRFEKYQVDVLGNVSFVKKEKRMPFN